MIKVTSLCGLIYLGKQGENLARVVYFDEPSIWKEIFGEGKCELIHQRSGDAAPYPVVLETKDDKVCWKVTESDTAMVGEGKCELHYIVDNVVVKSKIWTTTVLESLGEGTAEPPEPQKAWVDEVLEAASKVEDTATHPPIIGENKNWFVYDANVGDYIDSGVSVDADKALGDAIIAAKNEISDVKNNAITDIDAEKEKSTDAITQTTDDSLKVIKVAENNALSDIDTEKGEAVQTITQEKEKALSDISLEKESAIGAIEKEKQDVIGAVQVEAVKAVETVKEEAVSDIDAEKEKAIKEVQEQSANLATKDEVANVLKETATGEIVQLNVSPISHTVNVKLKSKNLIPYPFASKSAVSNEVSFTVNDDQTITVNGTPTVNTSFSIASGNMIPVVKGKEYTISYNNVFTGNEYFYISHYSNGMLIDSLQVKKSETKTFVAKSDGALSIGLVVYGGTTYNNVNVAVQLEEGDTATEITPYTVPSTASLTVWGADETDGLQTFAPLEDATYKIAALSPVMNLNTDTDGVIIEVEYNQDVNAFKDDIENTIAQLRQAIIELGGTV